MFREEGESSLRIPSVKLASGLPMPLLGLGTYKLTGRECTKIVRQALEMGYPLIDTAHVYQNHKAVASALRGFSRDAYFLTSKVALEQIENKHVEKSVEKACDLALKELGLDYLDLYLLHWPENSISHVEIVSSMQKLVSRGKIRAIGVSNCTIHHLQDLKKADLKVDVNQVEFHPYLFQKELLNYCQAQKIVIESYRPLGKGALVDEPIFVELAKKHKRTPAQIILRWLVQKEIPTIPKASSQEHLKENLMLFDFALSKEEMNLLDHLPKNIRFCGSDEDFTY
jgi:diketogulonate reductase-like aldo/keto reductase